MARPVGERDDARAAFVERALAVAIRAVVAGNLDFDMSASPGEHRVARAAVVALENDQRVVAHALLVERGDDPADLVVHGR